MTEIQSDAEFQAELLSLRETVSEIFETIFETEVRERRQFTKEDIGVPDDDEIWHDALRIPARDGVVFLSDVCFSGHARGVVDNPSDIRSDQCTS
jgi:hypothetical protein